jgi:hypothetical protein
MRSAFSSGHPSSGQQRCLTTLLALNAYARFEYLLR